MNLFYKISNLSNAYVLCFGTIFAERERERERERESLTLDKLTRMRVIQFFFNLTKQNVYEKKQAVSLFIISKRYIHAHARDTNLF